MDPAIPVSAAVVVAVAKSETGKIVAQGLVDGAGELLSRLCLPAANELGQILSDRLRGIRLANLAKIEAKAKAKMQAIEDEQGGALKLPQSICIEVMDSGSKVCDDGLQDLWAGLLASSCTKDGTDDSSLQFIHLISRFSPQQAKLFRWIYESCQIVKDGAGVIQGDHFTPSPHALMTAAAPCDQHSLAASLAGLASLGLFHATTSSGQRPCLGLSALGVMLSLRVRGITTDPETHFGKLRTVDLDRGHTTPARWG